ncbi:MAG: hypothetical protein NTZ12_03895 [Candidatus Aminicenantes bacterium]|nr:hypothetical protein [Candidatus Aminicenantes bacterium]
MKKEKMLKIGLISMMMIVLILGTTCKKSDESGNDINVIINLATQSISDINKFSGSATGIGNQKSDVFNKQSACQPISAVKAINQAMTGIVNPSPSHGWMTGNMGVSVYADCSVLMTIQATIDCSQGATMASGDTLGGSLLITGHIDAVSDHVDMFITETSQSFSVNGRSHNVFLNLEATGTLSGGTVTVTGHIDSDQISVTSSY